MKILLTLHKAGLPVIFFILLFLYRQKSFSQDSLAIQDFKKGVPASSFIASPGNQSAALSWASASYPSSGAFKAGYLLIYSTSTPSLVSSPDGLTPDFAVMNGTIVPSLAVSLPSQPQTFATAKGLRNGATYHFLIVAFIWDGKNSSSYQYSSSATICATIPPDGPANLSLTLDGTSPIYIAGSFSAPLFKPDGYLVLYSPNYAVPAITNGYIYQPGEAVGGDTVAQISTSASFNTSNSGYDLASSTTYHIYVFSYSLSACNNMPVYSSICAMDSITTGATTKKVINILDYFTATKANGYNKLTWKAAASAFLYTFQAERSLDSMNFTDIYAVNLTNAAQCAQPFNYNDYINMDVQLYYRIKATDSNGNVYYSNIVAIGNQKTNSETIHLEQNPVLGNAWLKISSPSNEKLEMLIFGMDGREVLRTAMQVQAGTAIYNLRTNSLANGMYIAKGIFSSGLSTTVNFIKQ